MEHFCKNTKLYIIELLILNEYNILWSINSNYMNRKLQYISLDRLSHI